MFTRVEFWNQCTWEAALAFCSAVGDDMNAALQAAHMQRDSSSHKVLHIVAEVIQHEDSRRFKTNLTKIVQLISPIIWYMPDQLGLSRVLISSRKRTVPSYSVLKTRAFMLSTKLERNGLQMNWTWRVTLKSGTVTLHVLYWKLGLQHLCSNFVFHNLKKEK